MGYFLSFLLTVVGVIMSIPFLVLLERKFLGYIQKRKGPKKASFQGILQPLLDGVKLIIKDFSILSFSKFAVYLVSPFLSFIMMLKLWLFTPKYKFFTFFNLNLVILVLMSSVNVYSLMGSGWSSKSKFSLLGSLRGACQVISYEVSLMFVFLSPSLFLSKLNLWWFYNKKNGVLCLNIILLSVWFIMMLAETNRAPFDFAEGESELVSGFNTEYSSLSFAFLFLGEYGSIMWMSFLTVLLFFFGSYLILAWSILIMSFFVWCRGTFPRFRYDFLMVLAWKIILPLSLGLLGLVFFFI